MLKSPAMPRYLRLTLVLGALLVCSLQPRAQVVTINLSAPCNTGGVIAWGQFTDGTPSPAAFTSNCSGTISLSNIVAATNGDANQVAAFAAGRGVKFTATNWGTNPLPMDLPAMKVLDLKVWVLYTPSNCDFDCMRLKMASFIVWANDRLSAERTGIQLKGAGTGTDWITDQTVMASDTGSAVYNLQAFSGGGDGDCALLSDTFPPAGMRQPNALNLYIIKSVVGHNNWGISCYDPLVGVEGSTTVTGGFANAFVGWQATNSTMLHELGHNLGLIDADGPTNIMNSGGTSFTEGQAFQMNFSRTSAMSKVFGLDMALQRNCPNANPQNGCTIDMSWIWPDP